MRLPISPVFLLSALISTGSVAERTDERIAFCKDILIAADRDGDGFVNYPEYHLHVLKQVSPYEKCPPVNIFGVQLDESYVQFHADECTLCAEFDDDPQCCDSNPIKTKWSVPGNIYPQEYTDRLCNELLDMIDVNCDDRPEEKFNREEVDLIDGNVRKLRYYLMALIPLLAMCIFLCCILCCGAVRNRDEDEEERSQGKSLDTKKTGSDKDDYTECDPTETDFDLEMNSPRSTTRSGNFAGLMSVVETEYEDDYMNEFQPRAANNVSNDESAGTLGQGDVEDNIVDYISSDDESYSDESSVSSASSSDSEDSLVVSDEDEKLREFLVDKSEIQGKKP